MTQRSYGFAIVGCGVIAPFHARALAELPNAHLVAVADTIEEPAAERGREFGVPHTTDLDALFARPDVDVISVCVPSGLHAEIGVRAARAGKHVLVEKPIDIALAAADRLIATTREHGVKLAVISQHRYSAGAQLLRRLIDTGRLGALTLGSAYIKWYRTQGYYDTADWRGTWALDGGGCLMNQGVHYVDLLRWLMGPVESVYARTVTTPEHQIEVEDIVTATLRFQNGALGVIEGSTAVFPGLPERLEIAGTNGTVIVEKGDVVLCSLKDEYQEEQPAQPAADDRGSGSANPAAISHAGHRAQMAELLEAIESGGEPLVTGDEARKPLELILAVYESARTGQEVRLS